MIPGCMGLRYLVLCVMQCMLTTGCRPLFLIVNPTGEEGEPVGAAHAQRRARVHDQGRKDRQGVCMAVCVGVGVFVYERVRVRVEVSCVTWWFASWSDAGPLL
jgi:hypothetical protein